GNGFNIEQRSKGDKRRRSVRPGAARSDRRGRIRHDARRLRSLSALARKGGSRRPERRLTARLPGIARRAARLDCALDAAFSAALMYRPPLHRRRTMTSELPLSQVLLQRIEHDYEEQPGLRLTPPQVGRVLQLDGPTCRTVLTALVDAGVLHRTEDGRVVRRRPAAREAVAFR